VPRTFIDTDDTKPPLAIVSECMPCIRRNDHQVSRCCGQRLIFDGKDALAFDNVDR
jgi:hypothetical protein